MTEKQKEVIERVIKGVEPGELDIKRHQQTTRELPTDSKIKNPFTDKDNSRKSDSKKK
ncbi:MAG TPA: hypothetical protein ACFYD3_04260 [Candidatus Hypogeohydataceae bacterium YC41]